MSKEVNEKGIATSIVILAVVVAALASGLVVSIVHYRGRVSVWKSRHKSAEENYNDLKLDYENLQSRVENLTEERESLRENNSKLETTLLSVKENLSKISDDLQKTKRRHS